MGRPHAGSARCRAGGRRRLRTRIAGMPTKPWGQAAMPSSGSACRTRCLLDVVVVAGISLTHPTQPSQRISHVNSSRPLLTALSDVRRPNRFPAHPNAQALNSAPTPTSRRPSDSAPHPRSRTPQVPRLTPAPGPLRFCASPLLPGSLKFCAPVRPRPLRLRPPTGSRVPPRTATTQLRSPPDPAGRGIRFGITPTLPLHSCLGVRATRRLSSVGRASHS